MADEVAAGARIRDSRLRMLGAILVVLGLAATVVVLHAESVTIGSAMTRASPAWLCLGFVLTVTASLAGYRAFRLAFEAAGDLKVSERRLAGLYFIAQMMRHLPGRYVGVAYQITQTRQEIGAGAWVAVNAVHSVAIAVTGLLMGLVVVLAPNPWVMSLVLTAWMLLGGHVVLATRWPGELIAALTRSRWRAIRSVAEPLEAMRRHRPAKLLHALNWAGASWLVYFSAWACYGVAFPGLGAWEGVRLSAYYALAWFVGFATLVTPSGWGVRELTFITVANEFSGDALAFGIVIGRVSLVLNDLVLGGAAVLLARTRSVKLSAGT